MVGAQHLLCVHIHVHICMFLLSSRTHMLSVLSPPSEGLSVIASPSSPPPPFFFLSLSLSQPESIDSFAFQELILPGQLFASILKDNIFTCLHRIRMQYMGEVRLLKMTGQDPTSRFAATSTSISSRTGVEGKLDTKSPTFSRRGIYERHSLTCNR